MSHEPVFPKSYRQEPKVHTSDRLMLILKNMSHIRSQNNITLPFNSITQKNGHYAGVRIICTENT